MYLEEEKRNDGVIIRDNLGNPIHPTMLAYVGDAVYELWVRKHLVISGKANLRETHNQTVRRVKAHAQAETLAKLRPYLTDAELEVVRMGRNTKTTVPRSASVTDYRYSTAFEALIGYLYLKGDESRLEELLEICDSLERNEPSEGDHCR